MTIKNLYFTLLYLKPIQLFFQVVYKFKRKKYLTESLYNVKVNNNIKASSLYRDYINYLGNNTFKFLSLEKKFENEIDWSFSDFGKLWNYNLEYFDFLDQQNISSCEKRRLIKEFYSFSCNEQRRLEPYPVSLRSINVIKFLLREKEDKSEFHNYLFQELDFLHNNYEYHILGNHFLENAFALVLGGAYFFEDKWHLKAKEILYKQLEEQILGDGAHFELSPMYHSIILFRLLELIEWYSYYDRKDEYFFIFCKEKASEMVAWLQNIKFKNNDVPLFNDCANGITYSSLNLISYAEKLGIQFVNKTLNESGYRSYHNDNYEIKVDLAEIGASYQPGHGHADALSFILYENGVPLFVEQGTSTYQKGKRRDKERSTQAHNTVTVYNSNQSEVWDGFRVAKRAKVSIHKEHSNFYEASHDGYKRYKIIHNRKFHFSTNKILIKDHLSKNGSAIFYLHLHPQCTVLKLNDFSFLVNKSIKISFEGASNASIEEYDYSEIYNTYKIAERIIVSFEKELSSVIIFER
ncbi:conserved hypothetical protein [Sphingobacterium sp. PM2-P1-29]|nr:conserved hypothetical protein [Sphingobacterium sp. PM2-P1-29]